MQHNIIFQYTTCPHINFKHDRIVKIPANLNFEDAKYETFDQIKDNLDLHPNQMQKLNDLIEEEDEQLTPFLDFSQEIDNIQDLKDFVIDIFSWLRLHDYIEEFQELSRKK